MTGLVDLESSRLWDFIEGRSKKVLVDRLEALGEGVRSIEAVVIDPYAGYKAAVRDAAPRATRVADHFHIVGLANAALTDVRTRRQQEITGHRGRKGDPLWSVRHDLLRAREHLTDRAWARLGAAFQADWCDELECAWTLKEMLRDLYTSADRAAAEAALADWHHHAGAFDVAETNRLAKTLGLGTRTARLLRHRPHQRAHRRHQPDHQSRQTPRLRLHQRRQLPHPRPLPLRLTHSGRQTTEPPLPHQPRRAGIAAPLRSVAVALGEACGVPDWSDGAGQFLHVGVREVAEEEAVSLLLHAADGAKHRHLGQDSKLDHHLLHRFEAHFYKAAVILDLLGEVENARKQIRQSR